ncbi:MAG TPA: cyclopropane-fatty-acyl-phospholipid synthase family protein [Methylophilaceae bacterium]|jgi:cyclopropane-fatty-acyl-phospholipid synthase
MATQEDIQSHYDVDNDFFALFLDTVYRAYSCGVWKTATTLEQAQLHKLDRICRFAHVAGRQRVLDVGCGWGGLMRHIASNFPGTQVHGLTLSTEQYQYVLSHFTPGVSVDLRSWRDCKEPYAKFDSIVSVGAFEHFATLEDHAASRHRQVYMDFFDWCSSVSTDDAYIGLQSIVINRAPNSISEVRDSKYLLTKVFPGSALPSVSDVQAAIVDKYEIASIKLIGQDYARTLTEWDKRLIAHQEHIVQKYGQALFDHYRTYFDAARRCFETGYVDLMQVSLRKAKPIKILAK